MSIDLDRITHPLRLAKGSHQPGSGRGCAMNVISYINGDTKITDYPSCSARPLTILVQGLNDSLAGDDGFLSPEDSITVLNLGWATVGTGEESPQYRWTTEFRWMAELLRGEARIDRRELAARLLEQSARGEGVSGFHWQHVLEGYIHRDHFDFLSLALSVSASSNMRNAAGYLFGAHQWGDGPYPVHAVPVEWVRDAIQLWRDLVGLDKNPAIQESDIDLALTKIGV